MIKVTLTEYPTDKDWIRCKERALVTMGKEVKLPPSAEWKYKMLESRHSPIRCLMFSFKIECPYYVSVHLSRHIHAQPYIKSQRNDRQSEYDRREAPQNAMVSMIWDMNAEELMVIANKRLCHMADMVTQEVVKKMCEEVIKVCPEFKGQYLLVSSCFRNGMCHEFRSCGYWDGLNGGEE